MVIKGKVRGKAVQKGKYLLAKRENDVPPKVVHIRGTAHPDDAILSFQEMALSEELTRSDKNLFSVVINPAYGEDRTMTHEQWMRAAEILDEELGLADHKRVMIQHEKNGRLHMHVEYDMYNYETGKRWSDSFCNLAMRRAGMRMEREFGHQITQEFSKKKPLVKDELTQLREQYPDAGTFIKKAQERGYVLAKGTQRPFIIFDRDAESHDLVRQLKGVKTKEVREWLKGQTLMGEKDAHRLAKSRKSDQSFVMAQETFADKIERAKAKKAAELDQKKIYEAKAKAFADARDEMFSPGDKAINAAQEKLKTQMQVQAKKEKPAMQPAKEPPIKEAVHEATNDVEAEKRAIEADRERRKQEFKAQLKKAGEQKKDMGMEMDF